MTTATPDVLPEVEDEVTEPDGYAHYVRIEALMLGGPVTALCGKRYVPTVISEAGKHEVCPKCADLMEMLRMMDDGS